MTTDPRTALADDDPDVEVYTRSRRMLFGIAYRILGNAADAEDVLQETWVRWQLCDRGAVREPAAFLATITTRLAINVLASAHTRRETYIGPWLPSPVDTGSDPTLGAERAEALAMATLLLMERLTPTERAAYVLREAFVYPYARIAEVLETTEAAARQLVSRARKHLAGDARRSVSRDDQRILFQAFLDAARSGDTAVLERMLADDAVSYTDGGGVVHRTARRPIRSRDKLVRFLLGISKWFWSDVALQLVRANGQEAALLSRGGRVFAMLTITVEADVVSQIMWVMNPAKLGAIAPAEAAGPNRSSAELSGVSV